MYHSVDRLEQCDNTMLLDFALFSKIDDPKKHISIAACAADLSYVSGVGSKNASAACQRDGVSLTQKTSSLQLASSGSSSSTQLANVVSTLEQLRAYSSLSESYAGCNESISYGYSGGAVVGVYVGSGLAPQGVIAPVLEKLSAQIQSDGSIAESLFVQLCDNQTARYSLGIFVATSGDLASVQLSLQSWKNSTCITALAKSSADWQDITFFAPPLLNNSSLGHNNITNTSSTNLATRSPSLLRGLLNGRASTCTTVQVVSGDSCATLAAECGITAATFTLYNPSSTLCSTLAVGEHVCCSAGTLPNYTPQPAANGNCYSYLVATGDSCSALAATYSITIANIATYNTNTWGWNGCTNLLAGYKICLSSGYPP